MEISNVDEFNKNVVSTSSEKLSVILFWATWHPPSVQMSNLLTPMSGDFKDHFNFFKVDTEKTKAVMDAHNIMSVPTVLVQQGAKLVAKIEGANPPVLMGKLKQLETQIASGMLKLTSLSDRLKAIINRAPVMLFIKGTPDSPNCGFSRQIVIILRLANISFDSFDILKDEEVRQGLKEYSKWPTYPQLYSKGNLVGGLDIVKEIVSEGGSQALIEELDAAGAN